MLLHRRFHPVLLLVMLLSLFSIPATYEPAQAMPSTATPAVAPTQTTAASDSIEQVGSYGGTLDGLVAYDTWLYAEHSGGVAVFDVSDPNQPVRRGHTVLPRAPEIADYANGIVYVATALELYAIDVTNPDQPTIHASYSLSSTGVTVSPIDLQVAGNRLYLLYDDRIDNGVRHQVQIFDVSDPDQLAPLGVYSETVWPGAGDIEVVGSFVYITLGTDGLTIVNATDPTNPTLHSHTTAFGRLYDIDSEGNTLYTHDQDGRLLILDVGNPGSPVLLNTYTPPGSGLYDLQVQGGRLYTANPRYPNPYNLRIFDVSDPANVMLLGTYVTNMNPVSRLLVAGTRVYLNSDDLNKANWLQVVDVSNPTSPAGGGRIDSPYTADDVDVVGTNAYVAARSDGLVIFDVSDPAHPRLRSVFAASGDEFLNPVLRVQVVGDLAYVAAGGKFPIADVSNPDNPALRGELPIRSSQLQVIGNRAYVISDTFSIINISDPSNPVEIVRRNLNSSYYPGTDIHVAGNRLYVSGGLCSAGCKGGVEIFDISNEANPVSLGSVSHPFGDVEIVGNLLYIMGDRALYIYDITNPASPTLRHRWELPNGAEELEIVGQYAYIAGGFRGGLLIADLSVPTVPKLRATYPTSYKAGGIRYTAGIEVVDDLVYVADAFNGLFIFRVDAAQFPSSIFVPVVSQ